MQSLVYFVVIFLASLFAFFAMVAMVSIHSVGGDVVIGGCGMCTCWWFRISIRMGCVLPVWIMLCYADGFPDAPSCGFRTTDTNFLITATFFFLGSYLILVSSRCSGSNSNKNQQLRSLQQYFILVGNSWIGQSQKLTRGATVSNLLEVPVTTHGGYFAAAVSFKSSKNSFGTSVCDFRIPPAFAPENATNEKSLLCVLSSLCNQLNSNYTSHTKLR